MSWLPGYILCWSASGQVFAQNKVCLLHLIFLLMLSEEKVQPKPTLFDFKILVITIQ